MSEPGADVKTLERVAESQWLKITGRAGMALFVPGVLWVGGTLMSVDKRLGAVEKQLQVSPVAYTRDEAVEFAKAMGARFEGDERWIQTNQHRIENLEDARDRLLRPNR